jgi:hypothetical protein
MCIAFNPDLFSVILRIKSTENIEFFPKCVIIKSGLVVIFAALLLEQRNLVLSQ